MTDDGRFHWAGVPFLAVGLRDAGRMRGPGLYAFVQRVRPDERVMLFVDHADCIATAAQPAHPQWDQARALGMDEIHICLNARERIDRLILIGHLVKRVAPLLNLMAEAPEAAAAKVALSA